MNVKRIDDLRAWQLTYRFKLAIYQLLQDSPLVHDYVLRQQIRESAASAVSQIEEGFARFYPKDNGRMVVAARASLKECLGHLRDAVDRGLITEAALAQKEALAGPALREIAGYLDYLQSEEAEKNALRIKQARIERRRARLKQTPSNGQPRTGNEEQRTKNVEPGMKNGEPGTKNPEPGTTNRTEQ